MNTCLLSIVLLMSAVLFCSEGALFITCDETRGCADQTLTPDYLYCYGYHACENSDITASSSVWSFGISTFEAYVTTKKLYAYGYQAGYSATIRSSYVYSYGYLSSYYADISPLDSILDVYFYGYYAGRFADISCYSGDTCEIFCGGYYGCTDSNFYCYSGALCLYDCSDDHGNCPTLIGEGGDMSSDLYLSDVQIKAIYDRNVAEKKRRAKAEKEGNAFGVESEFPAMDVFEHPPNFDGGIAHDTHCSEGTISYGMAAFICFIGVLSTVVGMTTVYYCMVKRINDGYFKI